MNEIIGFLRKLPMLLEESRVIVFLIDGLGDLDLGIRGFDKDVYHTVFPTSTPTFFYTLNSLLHPREHGFLEWYMRFRDTIVAIPPWKDVPNDRKLELGKDVSRSDVFPFKSLSEILSEKGFSILYYTPFAESTFTKAVSRGATVKGIRYLSQVFPLEEADFTFIYWPSIDSILHERYRDEALYVELEFIKLFIKLLIRKIPGETRLYILSDHGLTICKHRYTLPTIGSNPPVGGERVAFYKDVGVEEVEREITNRGIPADVHRLSELEYFKGQINPRCYENYGETIVLARGNTCFQYPFEKENKRGLGVHGGLTSEERTVILWKYIKNQ